MRLIDNRFHTANTSQTVWWKAEKEGRTRSKWKRERINVGRDVWQIECGKEKSNDWSHVPFPLCSLIITHPSSSPALRLSSACLCRRLSLLNNSPRWVRLEAKVVNSSTSRLVCVTRCVSNRAGLSVDGPFFWSSLQKLQLSVNNSTERWRKDFLCYSHFRHDCITKQFQKTHPTSASERALVGDTHSPLFWWFLTQKDQKIWRVHRCTVEVFIHCNIHTTQDFLFSVSKDSFP